MLQICTYVKRNLIWRYEICMPLDLRIKLHLILISVKSHHFIKLCHLYNSLKEVLF